MRMFVVTAALALAATVASAQDRMASPADAQVYIISPKDGAKVSSPVTVQFGLKGMGIAPAGVKIENTGHHHLLIDADAPTDLSQPLPAVPARNGGIAPRRLFPAYFWLPMEASACFCA